MKTKLKIFKKRFVSVFMAAILFLGCFGYARAVGNCAGSNKFTDAHL